jgi:hypothetical protein
VLIPLAAVPAAGYPTSNGALDSEPSRFFLLVTSYHPESGWLSIDRALAELADVSHRPEKNTCVRGAVKDLCPEAVVITQIEGRMVRVLRKETNAATTLFLECLP